MGERRFAAPALVRSDDLALAGLGDDAVTEAELGRRIDGDWGVAMTAAEAESTLLTPPVHTNGREPESHAAAPHIPARWLTTGRPRARSRTTAWSLLDGSAWPWLRPAVDLLLLAGLSTALVAAASVESPGVTHAELLSGYPLLVVAVMALRGTYSRRMWSSTLDAVGSAIVSASLATAIYVTVTAFAGVDFGQLDVVMRVSAGALAVTAVVTAIHQLARRWAHRTGRAGQRALIVGCGVVGTRIVTRLRERPEHGVIPIAMLDDEAATAPGGLPAPVVGAPEDLVQAAAAVRADHVILAFSRAPDHELVDHLRSCEAAGLQVSVVPRLFESMNERVELQRIGALPLIALHSVDPKGWQFSVKYALDRFLAVALLVVLAPLLLLVAAAVRLTSRGPALFRQRRVGVDGQVFDLVKFRSMRLGSDEETFEPCAGLAPGGVEGSDRRTPIGRLIRRTFIDELPQLINVLRGEMSLIGPRPERPEFVALFAGHVHRYGERHRVRSGITGWAQVNGLRGQTSLPDRIELDNHYIDNWSVTLDLKILLLTLAAVLSADGDD